MGYFVVKPATGTGGSGTPSLIINDNARVTDEVWSSKKTSDEIALATIAGGGTAVTDSTINGNIKVNGSEIEAYKHPSVHPPAIITQDESNRFVTDTEKSTWNSKTVVSSSTTNGNVKINGNETVIYTHPAKHSPSEILTDATSQFTSQTEKDWWNGKANADTTSIKVGTTTVAGSTVELVAGSNITLTPNNVTKKITVDATVPVVVSAHSDLTNLTYATSGHTGFSPTIHSHAITDITDLTTAIANKIDVPATSAQGDILFRNSGGWYRLPAGVNGQVLQTQGANANPLWATPATSGSGSGTLTGIANKGGLETGIAMKPLSALATTFASTDIGCLFISNEGLMYRRTTLAEGFVLVNTNGVSTITYGFDYPNDLEASPIYQIPRNLFLKGIVVNCDFAPSASTGFSIYINNNFYQSYTFSTAKYSYTLPSSYSLLQEDCIYVKMGSARGLGKVTIQLRVVNR